MKKCPKGKAYIVWEEIHAGWGDWHVFFDRKKAEGFAKKIGSEVEEACIR